MKTIIKLAFLSLLTPLFAGAMQQNQMAARTGLTLTDIPAEVIGKNILPYAGNLEFTCDLHDHFEDVGQSARSLARTCKTLNTKVNSNTCNDNLMRELATIACVQQWGRYDYDATVCLRTLGARNWLRKNYSDTSLDIQELFLNKNQLDLIKTIIINSDNPQITANRKRMRSLGEKRWMFLLQTFPYLAKLVPVTFFNDRDCSPQLVERMIFGQIDLAREHSGVTALDYVAGHGNTPALKMLIKAGANVNGSKNRIGINPLMEAASSGFFETVEILLRGGADPSITYAGQTALMYAKHALRLSEEQLERYNTFKNNPENNLKHISILINDAQDKINRLHKTIDLLTQAEELEAKRKQEQEQSKQGCSIQ